MVGAISNMKKIKRQKREGKTRRNVETRARFTHREGALLNYKASQPTQCQRQHKKGKGKCRYNFSKTNTKC